MANSTICHAWTKLMYVLCKAHHTRQHFNTIHGAILNSEITTKPVTNVTLNRWQKWYLFTVWELRQEGRTLSCLILPGNSMSVTKIFMPWALLQMTESSASIGCGVQINVSTQANVQMWKQLIMRINCTKNAGWKMLIRLQWNSFSTSKNIPWK